MLRKNGMDEEIPSSQAGITFFASEERTEELQNSESFNRLSNHQTNDPEIWHQR